jgi:hypothetical protein
MGWEREDETVVSVFAVDVAVVSARGLGCGARSWEGTAQVEMAKPRPASLWLRIVEWESRKGMFLESEVDISSTAFLHHRGIYSRQWSAISFAMT